MVEILILGAGGHAKEVFSTIQDLNINQVDRRKPYRIYMSSQLNYNESR